MVFELRDKIKKMMLAEMNKKTRTDKVIGYMKEPMTIPSIFHCHSMHYEEPKTEVEEISAFIIHSYEANCFLDHPIYW
jgi:hypothetical protein